MRNLFSDMFNGSRLSLARRRRGLTKRRLAEIVGLQDRSIQAFENGEYPPAEDTLWKLAAALSFPVGFFTGDDLDEPLAENVSFRAMTKMSAAQRDAALGAGALAFLFNDWIESRFELPSADLLDLRGEEPEAAAEALRHYWGLGERPIRNMVHLLEAKGVRVFSLAENAVEVDAFSVWRSKTPYVFLNTIKSAEHSRFDAAHELGHLVLHKHGGPRGQDAEREANAFASAFLMPQRSVIASAPKVATLPYLIHLKKKWIVSVAALVYRLHSLKLLSDWHYRTLCVEIAEKGYRKSEPNGAQRETSQVWEKVFSELRAEGMTKRDVAECLCVNVEEVEKLIFGLVVMGLSRTGMVTATPRKLGDHLRVVK